MRYLPIVMGVCSIVLIKIIKIQMGREQYGSWDPINIGMPHAGESIQSNPFGGSQRTPKRVFAIAGATTTEGKSHYAVRGFVRAQLRGWTGNPSAGGESANRNTGT
jgi:hypothetical protein